MKQETKSLLIRVFYRFLRGFMASFLPSAALFLQTDASLQSTAIMSILLSSSAGGLLAIDKLIRNLSFNE